VPLKNSTDPAWLRVVAVVVNGEALWVHDCGGINWFTIGVTPKRDEACPVCEMRHGRWKPILVEHEGTTRANTSIAQDQADLEVALRIAPGSTHRQRLWRWKDTETGVSYRELPAYVDPADPHGVRETAVRGSVQGPWWPADSAGPL
jgi:hypothetical protein